ncbi:MAG: hypothetical protein V4726_09735 [Verrucomicrobiota bacterium]
MKLTLLASSLALLALGLPARAQTEPAAKPKAAAETAAEKAAAATDKVTDKAKATVKKTKEKAAAATEKAKTLPFYGEVTAVDEAAKTVTLGENVYHLTDTTTIHDGEKAAKFSDVKVGRKIGGSCTTTGGKKELIKLNVGVKQESAKPAPKAKTKPAAKETAKPEAKAKPETAPAEAAPETPAPAEAAPPAKTGKKKSA